MPVCPRSYWSSRVRQRLLTSALFKTGSTNLQWFAACKPATIGVPSFSDDTREYLEIAVVGCAFRPMAKAARSIELIHRAIPYPVLLITTDEGGLAISAAHKRRAQNEADRMVVEQVIAATGLAPVTQIDLEAAFLQSLQLVQQPRSDLFALYSGWQARIEAFNAGRVTGAFNVTDDARALEARRKALDAFERLSTEADRLRTLAARAKQMKQRIELNSRLQIINEQLSRQRHILGGLQTSDDFENATSK
ncbi:hypothetical protein ACVWW4_008953 [Bradyrhizobium sp. LB7.1]